MSDNTFSPPTGEWYHPDEATVQNANVPDYEAVYNRAASDLEGFWAERAETLEWYQKWDQVLDASNAPFYKWFTGAKTNITHNALDRHTKTWRRNKLALIWEGENGDKRTFSYWRLWQETNKFANVLRSMGVKKGDTVTIYMGRIPAEEVALYQARGYTETDLIGRSGVEFALQDYLAGQPERYLRLIEPGGAILRELGGAIGSDAVPVTLTIDRDLQMAAGRALNDAFNYALPNWGSRASGAAVAIMDVNTGAILALASYPMFDPGLFNPGNSYFNTDLQLTQVGNDPRRPLSNKAIQEQYTPGSIYKIITTAAAAQENIYPPDEIFNCSLTWNGSEYGDTLAVREDWRVANEREAAGPLVMTQALTTSCNPFFWEMGGLMWRQDRQMLVNYAAMLGLGEPIGLNVPELEIGNVLGPEAAGDNALPIAPEQAINNAIGQGDVKVTVLQFVQAVTALANRGTLYHPYVVQQVGGADGTDLLFEAEPQVIRELPLRDDVYDIVFEGMCAVPVDPVFGTGIYAFAEKQPYDYTTCGKTGTAQAGAPGTNIPPHAWYASFAPAQNPQIAMVVVVPNSREGSEVAAHISRRIYDAYFNAPVAPWPEWWRDDYVPLQQPAGVVAG